MLHGSKAFGGGDLKSLWFVVRSEVDFGGQGGKVTVKVGTSQ